MDGYYWSDSLMMTDLPLHFGPLLGGMPMPRFSHLARMRLESISFFLMVLLLCAGMIRGIWNHVQKDFPRWPRLSYGKALGITTLWGLVFVLVLTMVSGARELLTPGAWEPQGLVYNLKAQPSSAESSKPTSLEMRQLKLRQLGMLLLDYASENEGTFPSKEACKAIDDRHWELPNTTGIQYLYCAGRHVNERAAILAYEPRVFRDEQLVLLTNGEVKRMSAQALRNALDEETRL